jgi:hypothetical protein
LYPMASPAAIDFLKKTLTCKLSSFRLLASYPKLIARRTS